MKFVFGKPVDEPFDREGEIGELRSMIVRSQPTALIGVRRIGKTSVILKTLKPVSTPKVYLSVEQYVEGRSFDLNSFIAYFSSLVVAEALRTLEPTRKLPLLLREKGREAVSTLRDLLAYLKLTLNINLISIELYFENRSKLKDALKEALELPQLLAEKTGENLTIVLDEFQYLRLAEQNYPGLLHLLRDTWQFQKDVVYVISGSSVGVLNHMISSREQPFYGFFYPIHIQSFPREISLKFLREGFEEEGVKYEEEALEEAVNRLDGIPAWLNLFGLRALKHKNLDRHAAQEILNQLMEDPLVVSLVLKEYQKLGKNAKAVLKQLAKTDGSIRGIDLSKSSTTEGLRTLLQEGYIQRVERGKYTVVDPVILEVLKHE